MFKTALRKEATIRRKALAPEIFNELNARLLEQFTMLDLARIKVLHTFLPIPEKREPDTWLIIRWLQQNHPQIRIMVPKADLESMTMTTHEFVNDLKLIKSTLNIDEPVTGDNYSGQIDMILLPLLAFDKLGNRVGYGKGFYDRFLVGRDIPMRVGISLFEPVDSISDAGSTDIAMNYCLTPQHIYQF